MGILLLAQGTVVAQTVTPQLSWSTTDAVAKVATYTTALKIGAAAAAQIAPACVPGGTGTSCSTPLPGFNVAQPTTITVTLTDPATGLSASGSLNYVPGTPPASFTLSLAWKITVP